MGRLWRFDKASIDAWLVESSKKEVVSILVVDDDNDVCSLFKDTLEEVGHTVITINDAFKGLELVQSQDFNLIFLDLKMPGMDGAELFKHIKEIKPNIPVTIVTGFPDSELMMKALTFGPFSIMNKPFSGADILSVVNNNSRFGE